MFFSRWFFVASVLGVFSFSSGGESGQVVPAAVRDTFWIDVRTPQEFAEGHLSYAFNIPLQTFDPSFAALIPDKHAVVALYCRSGNRSGQALELARAMGYSQAFNAGGYARLKQVRSESP